MEFQRQDKQVHVCPREEGPSDAPWQCSEEAERMPSEEGEMGVPMALRDRGLQRTMSNTE